MWIKAGEVQKGDEVFSLGTVESVTIGANNRATIYASERNVSCDTDSQFWAESLAFQPAF